MKSGNGNPTDNLNVSIPTPILARLNRYCQRSPEQLTKSQVVSIALKSFLASELAKDPAFWEEVYDKYDSERES